MRKIIPKDYKYKIGMILTGLGLFIFGTFPIFQILLFNADIKYEGYEEIIPLILLGGGGLGFLIKGSIDNYKIAILRKWRNKMLNERYIKGYIEDIEEIFVRGKFNKRVNLRSSDDVGIYYTLVVSYLDPITGYRKIIKSDPYDQMLEYCLGSNDVNVYINEENEVLIEDLDIRKSSNDSKIKLSNRRETRGVFDYVGYLTSKYESIIIVVGLLISVLIFFIVKSIVTL